jgi:hypothetical protein
MRNLIRSPLTWLVVAEFVVVGALVVLAWNVVGAAARPALASPAQQLPETTADASSPLPDIAGVTRPGLHGPLPGLNLESAFWRVRLAELNREQVILEQLEWRIVHSAMDALKRYLETVVLPAIQRAEHAGGGLMP